MLKELEPNEFSLTVFQKWLEKEKSVPEVLEYLTNLQRMKTLHPELKTQVLEISHLLLTKKDVISFDIVSTAVIMGLVDTYENATDDSKYIKLTTQTILPMCTDPGDWQYLNFSKLNSVRNTLTPITYRTDPEHVRVNEIMIKYLKRAQRKKPEKRNRLLINYLTKQLNHWTKDN